MEERRAKSLDALSAFIQGQRALLAQTESDLEVLKDVRSQVEQESETLDISYFLSKIQSSSSSLTQQKDITALLPVDFDWSLLAGQDPVPLKDLASSSRQAFKSRDTAGNSSTPSSTPLLELVRDRRRTVIDPVLASLPPLSDDEELEPLDPEELKRLQEREKIRELKLRKINGGGGFAILGSRRPRPSEGVFIREDIEDESAEVDIWGDQRAEEVLNASVEKTEDVPSSDTGVMMDVETPPTSVTSPRSTVSSTPAVLDLKPSRQRRSSRPTVNPTVSSAKASRTKGKKINKAARNTPPPEDPMDVDEGEHQPESHDTPLDKKGKPRPETYKQAWSVSEQHLLERLLEEIPEGEKNRWAKISKAMNGRRTARQVASRVQKYFEKLKRFGLEPGKA